MLAQIPDRVRPFLVTAALAVCAITFLPSCATKPQPQLVSDPDAGRESTIPWNKQEKWESQGPYAGLSDRR
ncbi:MAG: hypothetical protein M3Z64_02065 [Verrucomicrobiota bacterium]|nr:hypothetical protein [Verrucomicrobiota bacterium]